MLMAYRGTCDGLIYYYSPQLDRLLVRQYTKPRKSGWTNAFYKLM